MAENEAVKAEASLTCSSVIISPHPAPTWQPLTTLHLRGQRMTANSRERDGFTGRPSTGGLRHSRSLLLLLILPLRHCSSSPFVPLLDWDCERTEIRAGGGEGL